MTLEKKLVRLRKKEGMSQADVSEKLNVSRQAVSRWEAGDSRPSIENLQALCKLYNVKLNDLLDESNEEVPIEKPECQKVECDIERKDKGKRHVWATLTDASGKNQLTSSPITLGAGRHTNITNSNAASGMRYLTVTAQDGSALDGTVRIRLASSADELANG